MPIVYANLLHHTTLHHPTMAYLKSGKVWLERWPENKLACSALLVCGHADESHRPKKAGSQQWRVRPIVWPRCEGVLAGDVGLQVADQAVHPEVCHTNLDYVRARLQRTGQFNTEGPFPDDAERLSVDQNFGEVLNVAEIEPQPRALFEAIRRR